MTQLIPELVDRALLEGGYSYSVAVGDGVTTSFTFSFVGPAPGYISTKNISVWIRVSDPTEAGYGGWIPYGGELTYPSPNVVVMGDAPPAPLDSFDNIRIRRIMSKQAPYSDVSTGDIFRKEVLNNSFLQQLYTQHESIDGFIQASSSFASNVNMNGYILFNVGRGFLPDHSINKQQHDELQLEVDGLVQDCIDQADRAEVEADRAVVILDDLEAGYLGSRSDFPDRADDGSPLLKGCWMVHDGTLNKAGSYVYEPAIQQINNGWLPTVRYTKSGMQTFNATPSTPITELIIPYFPMDVAVFIFGLTQSPEGIDYTHVEKSNIITFTEEIPAGYKITVQMYISLTFATSFYIKGARPAEDILNIPFPEYGESWVVTMTTTTPPADTWLVHDTVTWTLEDEWENLGQIKGDQGEKGDGWVSGAYDEDTGIVSFGSDDGLEFETTDIRGKGWTGGAYDTQTGIIEFESDDGLGFVTDDLRGEDGQGLVVLGKLPVDEILVLPGTAGDMWVSSTEGFDDQGTPVMPLDGLIWLVADAMWVTVGPIEGPIGQSLRFLLISHVADGINNQFLVATGSHEQSGLQVFVSGVCQELGSYTFGFGVVTLSETPLAGEVVSIVTNEASPD